MIEYLVVKKGSGEGCDYTIGCNMRFDIVQWDDDFLSLLTDLKEEVIFDGERSYYEANHLLVGDKELEIEELYVVPMTAVTKIDLDFIRREHNHKVAKSKQAEKEADERKEYERLKARFDQ